MNLELISSLEKDIQKTEEEKNKCVKEFDSKIENMKNEILNLEFLIENSVDVGVDGVQINELSNENKQKQKELSDLQEQKLNRVAEYDKKIEENNNRLKSLNSEFGEF